jgi:hypothetical protein
LSELNSTGSKRKYLLEYLAPRKLQLARRGYVSLEDERTARLRLVNVPNLESATRSAHRSTAQYGQYSAPTYDTVSFVLAVEREGLTRVGTATVAGKPTALRVASETVIAA